MGEDYFAKADITVYFDGKPIGNMQSIEYTIEREIAPIYEIGRWSATLQRSATGSVVTEYMGDIPLKIDIEGTHNGRLVTLIGCDVTSVSDNLDGTRTVHYITDKIESHDKPATNEDATWRLKQW